MDELFSNNGSDINSQQQYAWKSAEHSFSFDNVQVLLKHFTVENLSLASKLKVLALMFSFIVVPAMIAFGFCYFKDNKRKRKFKLQAMKQQNENTFPKITVIPNTFR